MSTVVFSKIAGIPPFLFYLSGIVCWGYFADCLVKTSTTFTANAHLFSKVYFPRLAVPIAAVIMNLVGFGYHRSNGQAEDRMAKSE